MVALVIPGPPPPVPPLEPDPAGASSVASARRAATITGDVADWATSHGAPEGWSGRASEAADHALTALAGDLTAAVAAMSRVNAGLDEFYDEVSALDDRRTDLVEAHRSLDLRQSVLAAHGRSYEQSEEAGLRERATDLQGDIDRFVTAIETWQADTVAAEDALIAVLQSSDTTAEAHAYADSGAEDIDEIIADLIADGTLPPGATTASPEDFRRWLIDNPDAAATMLDRHPTAADGALAGRLEDALAGGDPATARRFFDALPPEDAASLALLYPGALGNRSGVPFEYRADANSVAVAKALADEMAAADEFARIPGNLGASPPDAMDSMNRMDLYRSILDNDRQILLFDPSGDGSIAELHGGIGPDTRNLGVFVPGATADLSSFDTAAGRASSFVNATPDGSLAMVSWMGGDFPDSVPLNAWDPSYARDLAPDLAGFSRDVRGEIDHSAAAGNDVGTTYMGHSYGGAAVGLGETHGLDADRILHMGSAGMGDGVDSPADLPPSQSHADRYSMTEASQV